jgi:TIR domain-containing protein
MPYVFFTSYARDNAKHPPDAELLRRFISDLSAEVSQKMAGTPNNEVGFFDQSDIETGAMWSSELAEALGTSRLGLALYSPSYFNRQWCGKEFKVLLDRRAAAVASGSPAESILPVLWMPTPTLPASAEAIQYKDDSFPSEYSNLGLRQLMRLNGLNAAYYQFLAALAARIVALTGRSQLPPLHDLDLSSVPSAWDETAAADPNSHTAGAISKTCFIFLAQSGWHWEPFPESKEKIGAIAQQVSGSLGLQYEEIAVDDQMSAKLLETYRSNVPTLLLGDPHAMPASKFAKQLRTYDTLYLLNCGMLVPWTEDPESTAKPLWEKIHNDICPQKTSTPPPHHEWKSILSYPDLKTKALTTIENIRLRLLENILSVASSGTVQKAQNKTLTDAASEKGIRLDAAPQIVNMAPAGS